MKKFFPTWPDLFFTARSPLFGNNFQNMNPKKVLRNSPKKVIGIPTNFSKFHNKMLKIGFLGTCPASICTPQVHLVL